MVAGPVFKRRHLTCEDIRAASTRSTLPAGAPKQASLPRIAHTLGVPLEVVERWVLDAPDGANLYGWARRKKALADAATTAEINTKKKEGTKHGTKRESKDGP